MLLYLTGFVMANHRKPKVCTVFTLANHSVKQIGAAGLKRGKTCARIQKPFAANGFVFPLASVLRKMEARMWRCPTNKSLSGQQMNYRPSIEGSFFIYKMNDITTGKILIYRPLYKPAQSKFKWNLI